ncbi:hypothetical protein EWM64_g9822 [Hericium alpestre]|uniref:Zinc finger PHD-type domain-containing protein n=1 Tax=Hericium alpestre TaxID=135208 RepID=A0A4Y9ZJ34_9AGAM|nr:hypothetical protein EWM64_g9822 [Hericium alpestre]
MWMLKNFEKQELRGIWQDRHKLPRKCKMKGKSIPLTISETHSSQCVLRNMDDDSDTSLNDIGGSDDDEEYTYSEVDKESEVVRDEWKEDGAAMEGVRDVSTPALLHGDETACPQIQDSCSAPLTAEEITAQNKQASRSTTGAPQSPLQAEPQDIDDENRAQGSNLSLDEPAAKMSNDPPTMTLNPTRSGQKRKGRDMAEITFCICGTCASAEEQHTICCNKAGCETQWYHLECVGLDLAPKN